MPESRLECEPEQKLALDKKIRSKALMIFVDVDSTQLRPMIDSGAQGNSTDKKIEK
jgi:hypothetical protein